MPETVSLQQFLDSQGRATIHATVEEVPEKLDMVKVTPWVDGHECLCHAALVVPKAAVESLTMTDERHACCGKLLRVVEVQLKKDASVPVEAVLSQLLAGQRSDVPSGRLMADPDLIPRLRTRSAFRRPDRNARCRDRHEDCLANAIDDCDVCLCRNAFCACTGGCRMIYCPC